MGRLVQRITSKTFTRCFGISFKSRANGSQDFYVTNRKYEYEKGTLENFKKFGIPIEGDEDSLLMRYENGWDSNKTSEENL